MVFEIKQSEVIEIMNQLFDKYLKKISVAGINDWIIGDVPNKTTSLIVRQPMSATKTKQYIGGDFEVELSFQITHLINQNEYNSASGERPLLNKLATIFEKEDESSFNDFGFTGIIPIKLEMKSIPEKKQEDENIAEYTATYTLTYKVKGRFK